MRYKKDISPLSPVLHRVKDVSAYTYTWDTGKYPDRGFTDARQLGFIAQEIMQSFPELVLTDTSGYMSVDYAKMSVVLLQGVKEQQDEILRLRTELDDLKKESDRKFTSLEQQIVLLTELVHSAFPR